VHKRKRQQKRGRKELVFEVNHHQEEECKKKEKKGVGVLR
jgi:hypothetical protein